MQGQRTEHDVSRTRLEIEQIKVELRVTPSDAKLSMEGKVLGQDGTTMILTPGGYSVALGQGGATLILRDALREMIRREARPFGTAALDAPVRGTDGLRLGREPLRVGEIWQELVARDLDRTAADADVWRTHLQVIADEGCLARRILRAAGSDPSRERLEGVYRDLCEALAMGLAFQSGTGS